MIVDAVRLGTGQLPNIGTSPLVLESAMSAEQAALDVDLYHAPPPPPEELLRPEPLQVQIWATPSTGTGQQLMVHFRAIPVSGDPAVYDWDFGDGTRDLGGWPTAMHTYRARLPTPEPHPEHFRACLRARDDHGQVAEITLLVTLWVPGIPVVAV